MYTTHQNFPNQIQQTNKQTNKQKKTAITENITKQNSTTSLIHYISFLSFAGPILKKKWKMYGICTPVPEEYQTNNRPEWERYQQVWKLRVSETDGNFSASCVFFKVILVK